MRFFNKTFFVILFSALLIPILANARIQEEQRTDDQYVVSPVTGEYEIDDNFNGIADSEEVSIPGTEECVENLSDEEVQYDDDDDNDGWPDLCDNCTYIANPDQEQSDVEGIGSACPGDKDMRPADEDENPPIDEDDDLDDDGILDDGDESGEIGDFPCMSGETDNCDDNCIDVPNPDQLDSDGNGIGDACESDENYNVNAFEEGGACALNSSAKPIFALPLILLTLLIFYKRRSNQT